MTKQSDNRHDRGAEPASDTTARATARSVAAIVLERVAHKGAYASRALDAEIARARLEARDAALATEIVYGSLRVLPALDAAIRVQLRRADQQLDSFVEACLRAAAYQLTHLGRLPTHAIVDETVSAVRARRNAKLAGFANAVLRKLAATRPERAEPPRTIVLPAWVEACLRDALGSERLQRFLTPSAAPALVLRCENDERAALMTSLQSALPSAEFSLAALSPLAIIARRTGSVRTLPGYERGELSVQEEGAQLIALGLGVQSGESIADVCAGHGGKTTLLARQVGAKGRVFAVDRDERKLDQIAPELLRLGLAADRVDVRAVDLCMGTAGLTAQFDRVLVDAPCSGLGTVHRRPELLLRLTPADPERLGELQLAILTRAASLVRLGGVLGYAVCSPTRAEGAGVAERFSAQNQGFCRITQPLTPHLPPPDADGITRIGPWLAEPGSPSWPDAYQLVLWRRHG